jgi:hypothetical protein
LLSAEVWECILRGSITDAQTHGAGGRDGFGGVLLGRVWLRSDVLRLGWLGVQCISLLISLQLGIDPLRHRLARRDPALCFSCITAVQARSRSRCVAAAGAPSACARMSSLLRSLYHEHTTRLAAQHSGGTQHATAPARTLCQTEHSHLSIFGIRTAV